MDTHTILIRLDLDGRQTVETNGQQVPLAVVGKRYLWKGKDAELVELIYALKKREVIVVDGQPADIKDLAELFRNWFGRELPNVYYTQMENQRRKKDKTPFLNSLIKVLGSGELGD